MTCNPSSSLLNNDTVKAGTIGECLVGAVDAPNPR